MRWHAMCEINGRCGTSQCRYFCARRDWPLFMSTMMLLKYFTPMSTIWVCFFEMAAGKSEHIEWGGACMRTTDESSLQRHRVQTQDCWHVRQQPRRTGRLEQSVWPRTIELRSAEAQLAQQQLQLSALVVAVPRGGMHVLTTRVRLMHPLTHSEHRPALRSKCMSHDKLRQAIQSSCTLHRATCQTTQLQAAHLHGACCRQFRRSGARPALRCRTQQLGCRLN
jgi:hypothetical protein